MTGKPNGSNVLCPKIKANTGALAAMCAPGNQNFMARAKQTRTAVIGERDAGLIKIAVPIFAGDAFLGTAGGCGLLPEGSEVDTFMVHKAAGMPEAAIASPCKDLGTMSQAQAGEMAVFIEGRLSQYLEAVH